MTRTLAALLAALMLLCGAALADGAADMPAPAATEAAAQPYTVTTTPLTIWPCSIPVVSDS